MSRFYVLCVLLQFPLMIIFHDFKVVPPHLYLRKSRLGLKCRQLLDNTAGLRTKRFCYTSQATDGSPRLVAPCSGGTWRTGTLFRTGKFLFSRHGVNFTKHLRPPAFLYILPSHTGFSRSCMIARPRRTTAEQEVLANTSWLAIVLLGQTINLNRSLSCRIDCKVFFSSSRTMHSMKERFRRVIIKNIRSYSNILTPEQIR